MYKTSRHGEVNTVLELLVAERVLSITHDAEQDTFDLYELCDEYFYVTLTRQQLLELGKEIMDLALAKECE